MKKRFAAAALLCFSLAGAANAQVSGASSTEQCGFADDAPIFGIGVGVGTDATPILQPIEQGIVQRGDRSSSLRSVQVPAMDISAWPADYAMMRLSQAAGRPIWTVTETGGPGPSVSTQIPSTNLADAFDRIAAVHGKRWRFDGERAYLLGGREWTLPMPQSRDLAIAVADALSKSGMNARISNGAIRFEADDAGAAQVSSLVRAVYSQERLNPYDVRFYKVYPTRGEIDWSTLVERTDSVESVSFEGKGATVVLDPTAGSVIDAFLAREGDVRSLGSATMVASQADGSTTRAAGCGSQADASRGLELAGGAYDRGRVPLRYSVLGASQPQGGTLAVAPGSVVVIADGEPNEGAYMVAVVRPRVIELQSQAPAQAAMSGSAAATAR